MVFFEVEKEVVIPVVDFEGAGVMVSVVVGNGVYAVVVGETNGGEKGGHSFAF